MTIKTKPNLDWRIVCTALVCIAVTEIYALSRGINGTYLMLAIGAIAGLAGYIIPSPLKVK